MTLTVWLLAVWLAAVAAAPVQAKAYESYEDIGEHYRKGGDGVYGTSDDSMIVLLTFHANGGEFAQHTANIIDGYQVAYGSEVCAATKDVRYCYELGTEFGVTVTVPAVPAPTREDTTFKGWRYNGSIVSAGSSITVRSANGAAALVAEWEKEIFNLSVDSANGDTSGRFNLYQTYVAGDTAVNFKAPAAPSFTGGNTFQGWRLYGDSHIYRPGETITINPQDYADSGFAYLGGVWNSDTFTITKTLKIYFWDAEGNCLTQNGKSFPFRYRWKYEDFGKAYGIGGETVTIPGGLLKVPDGSTLTWNTNRSGYGTSFSTGGNVYDYVMNTYFRDNNGMMYKTDLNLYAQVTSGGESEKKASNKETQVVTVTGDTKLVLPVVAEWEEADRQSEKTALRQAVAALHERFDADSECIGFYDVYLVDEEGNRFEEEIAEAVDVVMPYPASTTAPYQDDAFTLYAQTEDGALEEIMVTCEEDGIHFSIQTFGTYVLVWENTVPPQEKVSPSDETAAAETTSPMGYVTAGLLGLAVVTAAVVCGVLWTKRRAARSAERQEKAPESVEPTD